MRQIFLLSEPQNHRCCYCGHHMVRHKHRNGTPTPRNAITRDHVEPWTHGGRNQDNLVAACSQCNGLRGDMDAFAFYNLLQRLFGRRPELRIYWHQLPGEELAALRQQCFATHERQLRGLAIRNVEFAFRHFKLVQENGYRLRA